MQLTAINTWTKKKESYTADPITKSEAALIRRCQNGERQAQYELYQSYKDWVFNIAFRMSNNEHEAEELTQQVFIRVFTKIASFKGNSAFSSWLYRMCINVCINHFRKEKTRRRTMDARSTDDEATRNSKSLATEQGNPILKLYLQKALRKLPAGYRMVFILYDIQGFNHGEIAEMLKISEGTSKSQLHKARKELRQYLAPYRSMFKLL